MGATYTRQSSTEIVAGEVINAADFNNEFTQLVAAFAVSTGHSHDGTTAEGGPVTKLLGTAITIGDGTAGTDIAVTFDGETSDGLLTWMEDEDHFKFSDDVVLDSSKRLYLYDEGGEYIYGDGTDLYLVSGADINIPADIGLTFGNDGEKIEGDGTDLTISGNNIKLTATADVVIPADVGITFGTGEKIEGNSTDLTVTSGADINLTATADVNIPSGVGVTFGNDGEKIEGDGTDLTISGNNINLTAVADVNIPSGVGVTFATTEKIESDGTDLSITVGSGGDINIPADIGVTFGNDGEKIEGDGTDLTISGNNINLTATADVVIPTNVGITFGSGEKIEGDDTNLTVTSGANVLVAGTALAPTASDGVTLGSASLEWSDLYLADSGVIYFGDDQDVKLTHQSDAGLYLKHTATPDGKPVILTLQTGEVNMEADDVLGKIAFQAPDESTGSDAILIAAAIQAVSEGDFSSTNNATKLSFMTGASEDATEKMTLSSGGNINVTGEVTGLKVNASGDTGAGDHATMGYTSAEGLILTGQGSTNDVTIKNDADADVITIATGTTNVDVVGDVTARTLNADGDTSAGDNAAIGYTAGEGLILTGQGSTSDITLKNDADGTVFTVPTGTDDILFADNAKAMWGTGSDLKIYHDGSNSYIDDAGTGELKLSSGASTVLTISSTGASVVGNITATNSDGGAGVGPILNLYRNSASPADYDEMGEIQFNGENSASQIVEYGAITGLSADVTDGQEDGRINIDVMTHGSTVTGLRLEPTDGVASIVQTLHSASSTAAVPNITFIGNNNTGMYRVGANAIGLTTGGTKRMEINNTDVEISTGNIVFETSGKGVYLGVTSATAANLLDDYEEGIHTASVTCTSSGSYGLGTNTTLQYTKVGRKVNLSGRLGITSESSPSGGLQVSIPFTAASLSANADIAIGHLNVAGHAGTIVGAYCRVDAGVSVMALEKLSDAGVNEGIDQDDVDTAFELFINITYIAA